MLSVPRDTFVGSNKNRASGYDKINAIYSKGGPEKTLAAVEKLTGMDIKYYAVINNQVVIDLVNDIGGVYFDVPIDMNYDDKTQDLHIHLKKGFQQIDGEHAEQLLRFRHNNNGTSYPTEYGDNDFGRMKTQREFTMEVAKQTLKLKNITHIKSIMTTLFENVETNLTLDDVFPYVPFAVSFDTNNIKSEQITGQSQKYNELWFFAADKEETEKTVTEINNYILGIEETEETIDNTVDSENVTNTAKSTNTTNTTKQTKTTNTTKNSNTTKTKKSKK